VSGLIWNVWIQICTQYETETEVPDPLIYLYLFIYLFFADSIWWTRMPCTKPELLCCVCHGVLLVGIGVSYPAGHVHCIRMAANESTFISQSLSCYHTEIAVFCGILGFCYQGCILYITGKKIILCENFENAFSTCMKDLGSPRWKFSCTLLLQCPITQCAYLSSRFLCLGCALNKKIPARMELEGSLLSSQEPPTCTWTRGNVSTVTLFMMLFNINL